MLEDLLPLKQLVSQLQYQVMLHDATKLDGQPQASQETGCTLASTNTTGLAPLAYPLPNI